MTNLEISLSLVDGSKFEREIRSGKELVEILVGDDLRPPARYVVIVAKTRDGKTVRISVPADEKSGATAKIE